MPRIRSIKPEFCTSSQVAECSTNARLLFILLWLHCDDAGRHPANMKRIRMECFPGDSFDERDVRSWVNELRQSSLLVEYETDGVAYLEVTGWHHQRIDKPNYKYPPFDGSGRPQKVDDNSTTIRRLVAECSESVRRPFDDHSNGSYPRIGEEGIGGDRRGVDGIVSMGHKSKFDDHSTTGSGMVATATKEKKTKFVPPSLDDVIAYATETSRTKRVAKAFHGYYESQGWFKSNGRRVASWKHCFDQWKDRDEPSSTLGTFAEKRTANSLNALQQFAGKGEA